MSQHEFDCLASSNAHLLLKLVPSRLRKGFKWHYSISQSQQFCASNNLLKFLLAIIIPWINILANHLQSGNRTLLMTDSSTAEGWIRKTNFRVRDKDQIQMDRRIKVAQKFAMDFTKLGIKSYSQWFPGKENIVADALSGKDNRLMTISPQFYIVFPLIRCPTISELYHCPTK